MTEIDTAKIRATVRPDIPVTRLLHDVCDAYDRARAELAESPCLTCQGRNRHTVDMVCMTCGRDYMPDDGSDESLPGFGWKRLMGLWRTYAKNMEAERDEWKAAHASALRDREAVEREMDERWAERNGRILVLADENEALKAELGARIRPDVHDAVVAALHAVGDERDALRAVVERIMSVCEHDATATGMLHVWQIAVALAGPQPAAEQRCIHSGTEMSGFPASPCPECKPAPAATGERHECESDFCPDHARGAHVHAADAAVHQVHQRKD